VHYYGVIEVCRQKKLAGGTGKCYVKKCVLSSFLNMAELAAAGAIRLKDTATA